MAFLRRHVSSSRSSISSSSDTLLLPFLMAWAYGVALGEKLHLELESFYSAGASSTTSDSSTTLDTPPESSTSSTSLSAWLQQAALVFTALSRPSDNSAAAAAPTAASTSYQWDRKLRLGSSSSINPDHCLLPPACTTGRARVTDKTLVLDLDETLIFARGEVRGMGEGRFDFMLEFKQQQEKPQHKRNQLVQNPGKKKSTAAAAAAAGGAAAASAARVRGSLEKGGQQQLRRVYVRKRPHLHEFLEAASKMFEVVLFTAAPEEFATAVLERIDPGRNLVDHVLSRESCTRLEINGSRRRSDSGSDGGSGARRRGRPTSMVKDLGIIGRPLSKVIMVENSLDAIRYHLENGVHISSFYGDREDTELLSTLDALKTLGQAVDVRDGIIRLSVETQARKEGHIFMPDDTLPGSAPASPKFWKEC